MNKITMPEFKQAENTINSVEGVVLSIKKIDFSTIGRCPVKAKKFSDFTNFLDQLIEDAEALITKAKLQHEARPVHLINAASLRLMAIPQVVELEEKTVKSLAEQHDLKKIELEKQGFSPNEIKTILPFPQSEIDGHKNNITAIKVELENLEKFLADQLLCDTSLLEGAKLESYLQNQAG